MSLTLNAQIDKMEPPFGMQNANPEFKYYFTERYKNKFLFLMV
jgi:hypothetical protein